VELGREKAASSKKKETKSDRGIVRKEREKRKNSVVGLTSCEEIT